jgi:predicted O-linked N-acetylglucosamine transferase (SPINDLY family)
LRAFRQAAEISPLSNSAQYGLAICSWRLGNGEECCRAFLRAVAHPDTPSDWLKQCGQALCEYGKPELAIPVLRRSRDPIAAAAAFARSGQHTIAIRFWSDALEQQPENAAIRNNLAMARLKAGQQREALELLKPFAEEFSSYGSNYRLCALLAGARKHPVERVPLPERKARTAERIRIGFAGADLTRHSVSYFVSALLRHLDRSGFSVAYYSSVRQSPVAEVENWRDISDISDDQAAERIGQDGIDVLIDLCGHSEGHRLGVFARRPAPIQVSFLGYPGTTGMSEMHYRFTDSLADPPGRTESLHSETLVRLDPCFLCYTPPSDAPPVLDRESRPFTYGSFAGLHKVTPACLQLWIDLLSRTQHHRLFWKASAFSDPAIVRRIKRKFASAGVHSSRLLLRPYTADREDHLALYNEMDVALDTFPYAGTTTTCEALWMGVPVISMEGRTHESRTGVTILRAVGLRDWIVDTPKAYVDRALQAATDVNLPLLRLSMRRRLAESCLMNRESYVRRFEERIRSIL